jgi:hypothetical protein
MNRPTMSSAAGRVAVTDRVSHERATGDQKVDEVRANIDKAVSTEP